MDEALADNCPIHVDNLCYRYKKSLWGNNWRVVRG